MAGWLAAAALAGVEVQFGGGWTFARGDGRFDAPALPTRWPPVEIPHDWASEPLPPRGADEVTPVLAVRRGTWRFAEGEGTVEWASPGFDDSAWREVQVPSDWRTYGYVEKNAYGWFRRNFTVSSAAFAAAREGTLRIGVGDVASADVTFINGVQVGGTGKMGQASSCSNRLAYRSYPCSAEVLHLGAGNVIAVKVWSEGGPLEELSESAIFDPPRAAHTEHDDSHKSNLNSSSSLVSGEPGGLYDWAASDGRIGPFDPAASPGQKQTGYTLGGVGWYRKYFTPKAHWGDELSLFIEGCYMNCSIYLNGRHLLTHPYGYTSFFVKLDGLNNHSNLIAIRAESYGSNSRWYSGAGLFRPVTLLGYPALHVAFPGGVYVTTPRVDLLNTEGTAASATIVVNVSLVNEGLHAGEVTAVVKLLDDESGDLVGLANAHFGSVAAGASSSVAAKFDLLHVWTWSPAIPKLYRAVVTIHPGLDQEVVTFGVRKFSFSSTKGFVLNGRSMKMIGGCVHHDNGLLGSRAIDRAEERRVQLLKENGYNAIRTSHNPVSRAFIAACDRLGMLLMEEAFDCWDVGKNVHDYHIYFNDWWQRDIESMVLRDRNSPSIVLWSIGNEIPNRQTSRGAELSLALSNFVRFLDDGGGGSRRAITSAWPGVGTDNATDTFLAPLDVAGYNYSPYGFARDHVRHPERVIIATETFPSGSEENHVAMMNYPWVVGTFVWTAVDYIGESGIGANGRYPSDPLACNGYCAQAWSYHVSFCGDLDLVGQQRPQAFLRRVLWGASSLEMAVKPADSGEVIAGWGFPDEQQSWTWDSIGQVMNVNVYSSKAACILLSLNGRNVSEGCVPRKSYTMSFRVPFQPGRLQAAAFDENGVQATTKSFHTSGVAFRLQLSADRATLSSSRGDLSYVVVEVIDAAGVLVMCATENAGSRCIPPTVRFTLSGNGEIVAVGTGNPMDTSNFGRSQADGRFEARTYRGKASAIIRPGKLGISPTAGKLVLNASSLGLKSTSIIISVLPPRDERVDE